MKKGNIILILVVVVLVGGLIYFMPTIYKFNSKKNNNIPISADSQPQEETRKAKEFDATIVDDLFYLNMHINIYAKDTYLGLDKFTLQTLSNNDILANAFSRIYEGYIENHAAAGCAKEGKSFDAAYIDARIKNNISTNIKYDKTDFTIYDSKYPGLWKYDASSDTYIYNGYCENEPAVKYYDLRSMVSHEEKNNNKTIEVISKIAFAKVEGNKYIIYKDANMTQELANGNFTDIDALNSALSALDTNIYKYTFQQGFCTYESYCLVSGELLNG